MPSRNSLNARLFILLLFTIIFGLLLSTVSFKEVSASAEWTVRLDVNPLDKTVLMVEGPKVGESREPCLPGIITAKKSDYWLL